MTAEQFNSSLDTIKFEFLMATLEELSLEDENVEKSLMLYRLKKNHKSIYNLLCDFTTKRQEIDVSDETIIAFMKEKLMENCVQLYNFMQTNEDVSKDSISVEELTDKLSKEVRKFEAECEETRKDREEEAKIAEEFIKLYEEYCDLLKQYIEQYAIGFKISFDQIKADVSCAKAQALCMKSRLQETKAIAEEYGRPEKIQKAKATREKLEEENRVLRLKLKEEKALLEQYESLDPQLLMEYQRLKEDLRCRQWAVDKLNSSNCSGEIFL